MDFRGWDFCRGTNININSGIKNFLLIGNFRKPPEAQQDIKKISSVSQKEQNS
jgi:hypothetical protein